MSAFLRIGYDEVPVAENGATQAEPVRLGQSSRAFDNSLRSTVRSSGAKGVWTFTTPFLVPADLAAFVTAHPDGGFEPCSGLALGVNGVSPFAPILCEVKHGTIGYGWRDPASGVTHDRTLTITLSEV